MVDVEDDDISGRGAPPALPHFLNSPNPPINPSYHIINSSSSLILHSAREIHPIHLSILPLNPMVNETIIPNNSHCLWLYKWLILYIRPEYISLCGYYNAY